MIHPWQKPATHPNQQLVADPPYIAPEPLPHASKFMAEDPGSDDPLAWQHRPTYPHPYSIPPAAGTPRT
jgi:hypothetical protein